MRNAPLKLRSLVVLALITQIPSSAFAQSVWGPQDYWYQLWVHSDLSARAVAWGANGTVICCDPVHSNALHVIRPEDGEVLDTILLDAAIVGVNSGPRMETARDGSLFLAFNNEQNVYHYSPSLEFLGIFVQSPNGVRDLCVASDGRIIVAEQDRVLVYNQLGELQYEWTSPPNNLDAQFNGILRIDVGPDGILYVGAGGPKQNKRYTIDGQFLGAIGGIGQFTRVGRDGLLYGTYNVQLPDGTIQRFTPTNTGVDVLPAPNGMLFLARHSGLPVLAYIRSTYVLQGEPRNAFPETSVASIQQRDNSAVIDIDYTVFDHDDDTVSVGALAFLGSGDSLNGALRLSTLVEGTHTNLGSNLAANVPRRISWDMGADYSTNFVPVAVDFFAVDSSGLMSFDFITIPAYDGEPDLTISRVPLQDVFPIIYWLVATDDPRIEFRDRQVFDAATDELLAYGTTITAEGQQFLYDVLGVRAATPAEIQRASEGATPGTVNQFSPRFQINGIPKRVNEFGFDTGSYTDPWFVVPTGPLP